MRHFRNADRLSRAGDILITELDNETVLMSIKAGAYYGLEGSARSIWTNLETPIAFSALVELLVEKYGITPQTCAEDLQKFLRKMEHEGLLHVE
jgi:hypothetical protein